MNTVHEIEDETREVYGVLRSAQLGGIDDLLEADQESLRRTQVQIVNRMNQIRVRRLELSAAVHEDEGLRDEQAAIKSMANAINKLLESA